jgi:hypothetical protein
MSIWKNRPDGRTVRRQKIAAKQWAWLSIEAMESPAYRALSLSGHRVLARIQIEHAHHGGADNGKLPVTFRDFQRYGIHPNAIAPAIREVATLGFIRITREGVASSAKEYRVPNLFALTHLPTNDGQDAATDDWRRHKTIEDADEAARNARSQPARNRKFAAKRQGKKTDLRYDLRIKSRYGKRTKKGQHSDTETVALAINENRSAFYISGRGRANGHDRDAEHEREPST